MRYRGLRNLKVRIDVGLESFIELFAFDLENRVAGDLPARIIDQDVETAELADRVFHKLSAKCLLADVPRQGDCLATGLAD